MRAKTTGFKRTRNSKKSLGLGKGIINDLEELMDSDEKDIIRDIERHTGSNIVSVAAMAPGYQHSMPKVYINRMLRKAGLLEHLKIGKTWIPSKHAGTHYHRFFIKPESRDLFPSSFYMSLWSPTRFEW